jgi:hypothetical protein
MTSLRSTLAGAFAAAAAFGGAFAAAPPAHALVACNRWDHCWYVRHRYWPPRPGIFYRSDAWWWRHQHHRRAYDRDDRY